MVLCYMRSLSQYFVDPRYSRCFSTSPISNTCPSATVALAYPNKDEVSILLSGRTEIWWSQPYRKTPAGANLHKRQHTTDPTTRVKSTDRTSQSFRHMNLLPLTFFIFPKIISIFLKVITITQCEDKYHHHKSIIFITIHIMKYLFNWEIGIIND